MAATSEAMEAYFKDIEEKVMVEYDVAKKARKKGFDPEERVDSPLARNMVERVEGLISAAAPQLIGSGVTERMFELEKKYGVLDWRVSLVIAEEVAKEKFCTFKDKREAMEVGIRTGFAYHTLGIVAAPLEGFIALEIKKTKNGKEYFSLRFSGPIRGAGGTGCAVCVLIGDYVRKVMGYAPYDPDENEARRYVTELTDYHERITNLQYFPSEEEVLFLAKHVPVEVAGDPTEKFDVSNQKDLPRVDTNKIRGGMCLVFSMVALKAPKLWKRLEKWNDEMGLEWSFMKEFLKIQKKKKAEGSKTESNEEEKPKITANTTFISDLVAGRPVLTHPMTFGGFRLRYGRTRTTGYSAAAISPATMALLQDFIAIGTQLKVERPGKAASITACDSLTGPIARLKNGNVVYCHTYKEAKAIKEEVEEIVFLGDILFNYGDFSENGHSLVPAGYCEEWWAQEVKEKETTLITIQEAIKHPLSSFPPEKDVLQFAQETNTPLHPYYTLYWKGITNEEFFLLRDALKSAKKEEGKIIIPLDKKVKNILEKIGQVHEKTPEHLIVKEGSALLACTQPEKPTPKEENVLAMVNALAPFPVKDKAGTFIGARMGRPEKAKMRKLKGSPHGLFPIGKEGDRLRCFQSALEAGKVTGDFAQFFCSHCDKRTILSVCEECNKKTTHIYTDGVEATDHLPFHCGRCKKTIPHNPCDTCGEWASSRYENKAIDINHYFFKALAKLKTKAYPDLIKGVKATWNRDHIVEHPVKAILRAKHEVYVNKDGSVRYDMTELPITHFTPEEVGTPIEKLRELGYVKDHKGNEVTNPKQVLELKPHDIILPGNDDAMEEPASEVLFRVGQFVDELLQRLYKLPKHYNFTKKEDVVGHLVIGLAPHISAAMTGRIIGFSKTAGCFAHPLWHAALRRDCDGDEASVSLLLDSLLNFSRQYLPDRIGGRTMDAPLVLGARIVPSEVDDMVQGVDTLSSYPLEFYEAALEYKQPWDVEIEQIGDRMGTEKQYEDIGFTHPNSNINHGVLLSAYKLLPSMKEKLDGQMKIAEQVRAVDTSHVAKLVIEKHFIKDLKGNLRKFSMQQFRCVKCNAKYRRPPLLGRCTACKGKILFTISEGSVIKYLQPSLLLAERYHLDKYLVETLTLTSTRVDEVFGREKEKQAGLQDWFQATEKA